MNRRDFLRNIAGAGGLAAFAPLLSSSKQLAIPASAQGQFSFDFVVEPGVLAQVESRSLQILDTFPFVVAESDVAVLPDLLAAEMPTVWELASWAEENDCGACAKAGRPMEGNLLDVALGTDLLVEIPQSNLGLPRASQLSQLDVQFFFQPMYAEGPTAVELPAVALPDKFGLGSLELEPSQVELTRRYWKDLYGWGFQFRGPEYHPFRGCVNTNVHHYNIEIWRHVQWHGWQHVMNMHIGTYWSYGRKCFVLYNNRWPQVCWRLCWPSTRDLARMFRWTAYVAAAVAGVYMAWWIAASVGWALAIMMFWPLFILA